MLNKKKIIAIVAFILIGFAVYTFANPREDLEPITETNNTNDVTPVQSVVPVVNPVVQVNQPVFVDNAPVITVEPKEIKVVEGYDYDVLEGVAVTDDIDNDLAIQTAITETEDGFEVTYTATDRSGNVATNTRTIKILDPKGDEDGDGYTNEEEIENETDFLDEEDTPNYDSAPSINIDGVAKSSVVYNKLKSIKPVCTDGYYGKKGVTCEVTSNINKNVAGTYEVVVKATDVLGNETTKTFNYVVKKRKATVVIDSKSSVYGDALKTLTYKTMDELFNHKIGIKLTKEEGTNAGSYKITGTYTNANYDVKFVEGTYTITSKHISLTALNLKLNDIDVVYDEKEHTSLLNKELSDLLEVKYTNNSRTNAGKQTASAFVDLKDEYKNNYNVNARTYIATINIKKANPTVPQVGELEAKEGTKLSEITLPAGFTLLSRDKKLTYTKPYKEVIRVNYCPQDTNNYNCVDTNLTVNVLQNIYTVTFMSDGKVYETQNVEKGKYAKLPSNNPKKDNYTFNGWSVDVTKTPVTGNMEVVASFTANVVGLKVFEKPNANFEFKKNPTYQGDKLIRDLIIVKEVYADGNEIETTSYTTNFDIKTTGNKTLVVNQGNIRSANTISYKVIENVAFQTKFEITLNKNNYRKTKKASCTKNCDTQSNTKSEPFVSSFLEITEHYNEAIEIEKVEVVYKNGTVKELGLTEEVRWSRKETSFLVKEVYDPVFLAAPISGYELGFFEIVPVYSSISSVENIEYVDITYTKDNTKTYVLRFEYSSSTGLKAISERKI